MADLIFVYIIGFASGAVVVCMGVLWVFFDPKRRGW